MKHKFETSDLALAAALTTTGYKIIHVDKSNKRRVTFCFENTPRLEETIEQFWSDTLLIPARQFFEIIKMLKTRIYQ